MCHLCALLHGGGRAAAEAAVKVYDDLVDWWDTKSRCKALRFSAGELDETDLMAVDDGRWTVRPIHHVNDLPAII